MEAFQLQEDGMLLLARLDSCAVRLHADEAMLDQRLPQVVQLSSVDPAGNDTTYEEQLWQQGGVEAMARVALEALSVQVFLKLALPPSPANPLQHAVGLVRQRQVRVALSADQAPEAQPLRGHRDQLSAVSEEVRVRNETETIQGPCMCKVSDLQALLRCEGLTHV